MEKNVEGFKRVMKKILLLFLIFMFCGCNNSSYKTINKEKALELIENKDAILIDVRSVLEYKQGHINKAKSYPVDTILEEIEDDYEKDAYLIVYCQSGKRSKIAAQGLIESGYKNVYDLGSVDNWNIKAE